MGSRAVVRRLTLASPLSLCVLLAAGCTATQVREFTRESYQAPAARVRAASRVFRDSPERIFALLVEHLESRGADVENADPASGRILAKIRWRSEEERAAPKRRLYALQHPVSVPRFGRHGRLRRDGEDSRSQSRRLG